MLRHPPDFAAQAGARARGSEKLSVSPAAFLLGFLCIITSVAFANNRLYLLLVFATALAIAVRTGVELGRFLLVVAGAVAMFALPVAVFSGFLIGPAIGELLLLRSVVATTLAALVFALLGTGGLLRAFAGIGMPRGLRAVLTISLGQMRVLGRIASDMIFARAARTAAPRVWSEAAAGMGTSGAVLLGKSLQQSDEVHAAMLARGFDGTIPQLDGESQWRMRDLRFVGMCIVIALAGGLI